MNSIFMNLRKENVETVFKEIASRKYCTVKDISLGTGLSIVTVGKITDALVTLRLITKERSREKAKGRRSFVFHSRNDRCAGIFSVSERSVRYTVLNMNLSVKYDKEVLLIPEMPPEDILICFSDSVHRELKRIIKRSTCIGEGVLLPCDYCMETDSLSLPIWDKLSSVSVDAVFLFGHNNEKIPVLDKRIAFIKGTIGKFAKNDDIFVIFAGKELSVSHFKTSDSSFHIGDCGSIILSNGKTFDKYISEMTEPEVLCGKIAEYCVSVINSVKTDKIIITGDRFYNMTAFASILREKILLKCFNMSINPPDIIYEDFHKTACEGIVCDIRNDWFAQEIL